MARNTSYEVQKRWELKAYGEVNVQIPKDLAFHFAAKCEKEGVSKNSVIREGIERFLEETK